MEINMKSYTKYANWFIESNIINIPIFSCDTGIDETFERYQKRTHCSSLKVSMICKTYSLLDFV